MTSHTHERLPMAITLGTLVVLGQLGCLFVISLFTWRELFSPVSPIGDHPDLDSAVIFRGEIYYRVLDMKVMGTRERIRAFDLKTGQVRDAISPSFLTNRGWVTDGQRLWGIGDKEIIETDGTTSVTHRPRRLLGTMNCRAFLYEGKPALIDRDANNVERLLVLVDGDWNDKGQVAMPGPGRVWKFDDARGRLVPVPRTSANSTRRGSPWQQTRVISAGGAYHVFDLEETVGPIQSVCLSYRNGLDLVAQPIESGPTSALAPENAPADTTGWIRLDTSIDPRDFGFAAFEGEPVIGGGGMPPMSIGVMRQKIAALRGRAMDGNIPELRGQVALLSSREAAELYAIPRPSSSRLRVFRCNKQSVTEMPYRIEGAADWAVRFWKWVALKVFVVSFVGTLLLLVGTSRLKSFPTESAHSFGLRTVQLASLERRCLAKGIDVALLLCPTAILLACFVSYADSETLYWSGLGLLQGQFSHYGAELALLAFGVTHLTVPPFLIMVRYEGCYGVTPGKWLCGIRTMRTTLRPCGFARALLRELLMWFDTPLLLTILPGMMCMLSTEQRQRIGDLVADTIVVEHDPSTTDSSSSARQTAMSS